MFGFEMLSLITIQSSLQIDRLPLHLLCHYRILQVRIILSNLHNLWYNALSAPHSALIHHWLAMHLPPHLHLHHRHRRPHTHRHHWFQGQTSGVHSWAVVTG